MPLFIASESLRIGVIGLGYVGLPLALEFGKIYPTVGFDVDKSRVEELISGYDRTREVSQEELVNNPQLVYAHESDALAGCNVFIVTVPTPIDRYKCPDLSFLLKASQNIAQYLTKGSVVVYESTVYPGCTEEECVPVLEKYSGLTYNTDFFCGYSPERINPGDKERTLTKILKITSGSTPEAADFVDQLYRSIIQAGTYRAASLKVAEAAKAIENAQRDVNISFVNELALIFDRMGIDTLDVLEAAGTKWNFLNFKPGLVGGHCISVDPYYLAYKAQSLGYHPQVILSGRRVNDDMPYFVANKLVKGMIHHAIPIAGSNVLILGFTFKENCPDIRNTKVADIYFELKDFGINVDVYDPWAVKDEVMHEYGISLCDQLSKNSYDAILVTVSHQEFKQMNILELKKDSHSVVYDLKAVLDRSIVTLRV
ncbi:nucleotide sugar dehydrogenase [Tellurirhabdus bombi]|uniref:nucleotide sugar dehydrogenase n=1 Tax=Tellurirhabdus bombi TaxID=2907205 RepID=UPI001F26830A|nr:nucleotide sugar dehydrogenase [Tellurirhabdus bombi]